MKKLMMIFLMAAVGLVFGDAVRGQGFGTAITHHGRLMDGGSPANDKYDFEFKLYDALTGGGQVGDTETKEDVNAYDGYFTVTLDFGSDPNVFDGGARWLAIGVRPWDSGGGFTTLSPRQEMTPTPYAMHAKTAEGIVGGITGSGTADYIPKFLDPTTLGDSVIYQSGAGNIGIGMTNPGEKLEVDGNININSVYKIGGETVLSNSGTANILVGVDAGANNTGDNCTFVGYQAGYNNQNNRNTFLGMEAGRYNTTGNENTFVGYRAGSFNSTGFSNTFVGLQAGQYHDIGYSNTFVGRYAGIGNIVSSTGHSNTFLGESAGSENTTGNKNTFLGREAGRNNETGSGNVFIGYWAGYNETGSNKLYIDNSNTTTPLIHGDFSTNRVGINRVATANTFEVGGNASKDTAGSWLANSDARIKTDIQTVTHALDTLGKVRLVSFKYTDDYRIRHSSVEDRAYLNVVAQEFAEVFPDYVKSSGEKLANGEEILQVDSYPLSIYSAAAVQELHDIVKAKDSEIADLRERLSRMETLVAEIVRRQEGEVR